MATKRNPGEFDCYASAGDDEPIFVLRSTDPLAPGIVREWAERYARSKGLDETNDPRSCRKFIEAIKCAESMESWGGITT